MGVHGTRPIFFAAESAIYKVICWMKKWALWDSSTIFSRGKAFSSYHKRADYFGTAERKQSGWRGWEDVWVWDYGFEELGEDLQDKLDLSALVIECGSSLIDLLEQGIYTADFYSLPDAARICLLRNIYLFESSENWWYEAYLKDGVRFDDTEFDSFDKYQELESANREEFKLDLLTEYLSSGKSMFYGPREEDYGCNREVAKLVLGELDEILKPYHFQYFQYWADPYCDISLCIGSVVVDAETEAELEKTLEELQNGTLELRPIEELFAENRKLLAIDATRPMERSEIDAILRKDEADIPSGKRDFDKVGMSLEEFRKRMKEAWEHMKN